VGLFDPDLRIILADGSQPVLTPNPATLVGRRPSEFAPPELAEKLEDVFRKALSGGTGHVELHVRDRTVEVSTHPVRDEQGNVVMGIHMTEDVTEGIALRTRLAVASRLAALGTLVAGVAHEINNPLAAELSDQELALQAVREVRGRLDGSDPLDRKAEVRRLDDVVEELEEAQDCGRKIERIVKDLKVFGRPDARRTSVRFVDVVDQAMRWLPATVARTAKVIVQNAGAPAVMASTGQIEQVVVNLVTNAAKATPKGQHGLIVIRIGPGEPGMARLDVIDRGTGIEPAMMGRIFDPFFTDGAVGKGMGLGLAVSHAIVTSHGGSLTATSVVGEGSTFRIELPAAGEEP
jgi:signal transduction histidine kinase